MKNEKSIDEKNYLKRGFLSHEEVEESLKELLYNVTVATIYEPYKESWKYFDLILQITKKWITYYIEKGNLSQITENEYLEARKAIDNVDFECFGSGKFYEWVDIWFDIVSTMKNYPVGKNFNSK